MRLWNGRRKYPKDAKWIDRRTPFGNPFYIGHHGTRDEVCDKFEAWVVNQPELVERARRELTGHDLVCWCEPERCHGETWIKILAKPLTFP